MKNNHKTEWVKVNVPVDKKIKELIKALSCFQKLQTIESCQEITGNRAYVCFYYGDYWNHKWNELTNFIFGFLGPRLVKVLGDDVDISVRIGFNKNIFAELTVRKESIKRAVDTIQDAVKHFN